MTALAVSIALRSLGIVIAVCGFAVAIQGVFALAEGMRRGGTWALVAGLAVLAGGLALWGVL